MSERFLDVFAEVEAICRLNDADIRAPCPHEDIAKLSGEASRWANPNSRAVAGVLHAIPGNGGLSFHLFARELTSPVSFAPGRHYLL